MPSNAVGMLCSTNKSNIRTKCLTEYSCLGSHPPCNHALPHELFKFRTSFANLSMPSANSFTWLLEDGQQRPLAPNASMIALNTSVAGAVSSNHS